MIKPYLYGGIVLLIVGLFSFTLFQKEQLKAADMQLEASSKIITDLELAVGDLKDSTRRKEGALEVYMAKEADATAALNRAVRILNGYSKRETDDEKCLDLTPPAELIRLLDESSVQGPGDMHSPKSLPSTTN